MDLKGVARANIIMAINDGLLSFPIGVLLKMSKRYFMMDILPKSGKPTSDGCAVFSKSLS
jgi:hypothetical protein